MSKDWKQGFTEEQWEKARQAVMEDRRKELAQHLRNEWTFHGKGGVLKVRALSSGAYSYEAHGEVCGYGVGKMIATFVTEEQFSPHWAEPGDPKAGETVEDYEVRSKAEELFGGEVLDKTVKLV